MITATSIRQLVIAPRKPVTDQHTVMGEEKKIKKGAVCAPILLKDALLDL